MNNQIYKTIGEVAQEINNSNKHNKKLNTHTLRFWEKHFKQIKPKILSGNRRYYSKKDIDVLKLIYTLLKKQGMTIPGAKKALNTGSIKLDQSMMSDIKDENFRLEVKAKVTKIKNLLDKIKRIK